MSSEFGAGEYTYAYIMRCGQESSDTAEHHPGSFEDQTVWSNVDQWVSPDTETLYNGLNHLVPTPLAEEVVDTILTDHWEFSFWDRDKNTLHRYIGGLTLAFLIPDEDERRKFRQFGNSLVVEVSQITTTDILDIVNFERSIIADSPHSIQVVEQIYRFKKQWHGYSWFGKDPEARSGDSFTAMELAALRLLTHVNNQKQLAKFLGISQNSLSTVLEPIKKRYNASSLVDLLLVGIAAGASVEHVPVGRTESLGSKDNISKKNNRYLRFLQQYFSNDPGERRSARAGYSQTTIDSYFYDACIITGANNGRTLAMYLVRDGKIDLPILESKNDD